jgi:hypothetical protein
METSDQLIFIKVFIEIPEGQPETGCRVGQQKPVQTRAWILRDKKEKIKFDYSPTPSRYG